MQKNQTKPKQIFVSRKLNPVEKNFIYNKTIHNQASPKLRPTNPKPPVPMELHRSIHSQ